MIHAWYTFTPSDQFCGLRSSCGEDQSGTLCIAPQSVLRVGQGLRFSTPQMNASIRLDIQLQHHKTRSKPHVNARTGDIPANSTDRQF